MKTVRNLLFANFPTIRYNKVAAVIKIFKNNVGVFKKHLSNELDLYS